MNNPELRNSVNTICVSGIAVFDISLHSGTRIYIEPFATNCTINGINTSKLSGINNGDCISVSTYHFKKDYKFVRRNDKILELRDGRIDKMYVIGKKLGGGGHGRVYTAYLKNTGEIRALKIQTNSSKAKFPTHEAQILLSLSHPCVIEAYRFTSVLDKIFLELEFMEGGDLKKFVNINGPHLSEPETKLIFYQICCGVSYLHRQLVCHRDLKPANILLRYPIHHTQVKISDLAGAKAELMHGAMSSLRQSGLIYIAPELRKGWPGEKYNLKVDVWSVGVSLHLSFATKGEQRTSHCIFLGFMSSPTNFSSKRTSRLRKLSKLLLCFLGMPRSYWFLCPCLFGKLPVMKNVNKALKLRVWNNTSNCVLTLLQGMLQYHPSKRFSISEVEMHSWFQDDDMRQQAGMLMGLKKLEKSNNICGTSKGELKENNVTKTPQQYTNSTTKEVTNDPRSMSSCTAPPIIQFDEKSIIEEKNDSEEKKKYSSETPEMTKMLAILALGFIGLFIIRDFFRRKL